MSKDLINFLAMQKNHDEKFSSNIAIYFAREVILHNMLLGDIRDILGSEFAAIVDKECRNQKWVDSYCWIRRVR